MQTNDEINATINNANASHKFFLGFNMSARCMSKPEPYQPELHGRLLLVLFFTSIVM
jgi:hypothetical protein